MRLKFILFLIPLFAGNMIFSFAGQPANTGTQFEKCGIVRHTDYLISKDPSLAQKMITDENQVQRVLSQMSSSRTSSSVTPVYTVPVVVHVVWRVAAENISDAQILSQIDVLNQDFARLNADTVNTPNAFRGVASGTNFQFCMAQRDPNGALTNGIERRQTTVSNFSINDDVKLYSSGGLNAWDVNTYLNIWVCNLGTQLLGYGEFPSSAHTNTFGVVIQYDSFGKIGNVTAPYNKGRTCTHEISHCFRLYHVWGDDGGACSGSDYCNDTPNQGDNTFGCPSFPDVDNCSTTSPGIMFMNYMDYTDDACMNMFTANQSSRMYASIHAFYPTLLNSNGCQRIDGIDSPSDFQLSLYPNPSSGILNLNMYTTKNIGDKVNIRISDIIGNVVQESVIMNPNGSVHQINLQNESSGIYFVTIYNDNYKKTERITINR